VNCEHRIAAHNETRIDPLIPREADAIWALLARITNCKVCRVFRNQEALRSQFISNRPALFLLSGFQQDSPASFIARLGAGSKPIQRSATPQLLTFSPRV
jgi:hypothetical protein